MSSVISEKLQSYVFSSNPNQGALNLSADGSSFSVFLDTPIYIPQGVIDCNIDVIAASIWNVSPNISAAFGNNMFYFEHLGTPYVLTIDDGLYSLAQLNGVLGRFFVNNSLPKNLIVFLEMMLHKKLSLLLTVWEHKLISLKPIQFGQFWALTALWFLWYLLLW